MDYRELLVYQKAREVVKRIYAMTKTWPKTEPYMVLSRQLTRAAMSIGANIAEGHGRHSGAEYIHFLLIAQGSANEVDHWLHTAMDCELGSTEHLGQLIRLNTETRKMLAAAINSLQRKQNEKAVHESPLPYSPIPFTLMEEDE